MVKFKLVIETEIELNEKQGQKYLELTEKERDFYKHNVAIGMRNLVESEITNDFKYITTVIFNEIGD